MLERTDQELKRVLRRHTGRDNPIKAEVLAGMFGYSDDRPIRKAIEKLIDNRFPVCSVTEAPPGYFCPASVAEARRYTKSLQSRAVRIFLRRRHIIRDTARRLEKIRQMCLEEMA